MNASRWTLLILCLVLPSVAYRVGGVALWWVYGLGYLVAAALALREFHVDGQLRGALTPRTGDAAWGFGSATVLYVGLLLLFRKVIAPGSFLPVCGADGALFAQPGLHGIAAVFEWIRDRACVGFVRSAGIRGPIRGVAVVAVAVVEELAWRAGVQQGLSERFGSEPAWFITAGLFVLANLATGNPALALLALPCGLLFGALYRYRGGLVPGLLAHALFTWAFLYNQPVLTIGHI